VSAHAASPTQDADPCPDPTMKTSLSTLAAAGLLAVVWTLPAHASLELAQKKACMACHQVERKVVGPSYAEIAKRYRGQADAAAVLAESIRKGGSGRWCWRSGCSTAQSEARGARGRPPSGRSRRVIGSAATQPRAACPRSPFMHTAIT
jgi:cytochrome c